jgi:acyl-homoserine-lactone acylase
MMKRTHARAAQAILLAVWGALTAIGCAGTRELDREGLAGRAEVRRDAYGVPHVTGDSVPAVVYAFAYAQAEDHIQGISRRMLNARGELAKHFGPSMVERDVFARRFRIHDGGEGLKAMSPEVRALFEAYAIGVNAYIEDHRGELPDWIEPITAADVLGASRAALMGFAFNRDNIIGRIQRENTTHDGGFVAEAETIGSNMFALAPERTANGKAILMGNPHLSWDLTWYEGHLTVPGEYNIYGASFVGGPVPTIAFNDALGWSHTVNYPDTEDVYIFEDDPAQPDHILYDGASHALTPVSFSLEVKTPEGPEIQEYLYWESEFGPVIHRDAGRSWVLKSSLWGENGFVEQWYRMGRAQNLDEFEAALDMNAIPMFNVIYADRDGNIYYRWMAQLPVRPEGQDGSNPVAVSESAAIWSEIHPGSDMPALTNPVGGYVHNANDAPWYTTLDQIIPAESYPPYMEAPRLRLRTQHGLELLHARDTFSLDDVIALKHSLKLLAADRIRDDLVATARKFADETKDAEAILTLITATDALEAWDGTSASESRGGVLFSMWWERYTESNEAVWAEPWDAASPMETPRGLGDPARGVNDLLKAARECSERFGSVDIAWGEAHRLRRGGLDLPMNGARGALGSYRVIDYKPADDGKFVAYGGDGWVFAVEFGETPTAYSILVYGQSESELSPHATDQIGQFIEGRLKPVLFTEEDIEANVVRRYRP